MPGFVALSLPRLWRADQLSPSRIILHEQSSLHGRFDGSWNITTDPGDRSFSRHTQEALRYGSDEFYPSKPGVALDHHVLAYYRMQQEALL
jgi:hypothetical protein